MRLKIFLRYGIAVFFVVFILTLAVLLGRRFSWVPLRPAPDFRSQGRENAKINIQEFTDFACPACKYANKNVEMMLKVYRENIKLSFKYYPLMKTHKWAFDAAVSAECAGKQGKFWDYAQILFDKQSQWAGLENSPKEFDDFALTLGLDMEAFGACRKNGAAARAVRLDIAEGEMRGVNATPTFFINKKRMVGANQLTDAAQRFDKIIYGKQK